MKKYANILKNAERIATTIHKCTDDSMPSIFSLIKWIEDKFCLSVRISYTNSDDFKASGLVFYDQKIKSYRIWINLKEPECRQRFTLCHEIAHIIRNVSLVYGFSTGDIYSAWGLERFCNRFAASYLIPADMFVSKWKAIKEPIYLKKARFASLFKVSGDAVYYRAKELKLIK